MFTHKLTDDAELRLIEPRHAEELYALIDKNRERLRPWMPFVEHATSVDAEREFAKMRLHNLVDGTGFECGVWLHGKLAGGIGVLHADTRNRSAELGYWLDKEAEGKGIVTAGCRVIIDHLFHAWDVNRVVIHTIAANKRSKAVANRLGFTHEGTARQMLKRQGEFVDVETFSLLKQDAVIENTENGTQTFFTKGINEDTELMYFEPHHAAEMFALVDRNREYLRRWLPWMDQVEVVTDALPVRGSRQLHEFVKEGTICTGIRYKGALAGLVGLHYVNSSCREIDYWLSEDCQGKGLVTTGCKALIDHAFGELGINRIEIHVEPENTRSRAVPERLGFTYEGTLRQQETNAHGKLIDHVVYSLLKEEWEERGIK